MARVGLIGAILFANFFLDRPELVSNGRVGVMLPAAAGVGVAVMGIMLARCAPVMINWTVGRASLEHVLKCTGIGYGSSLGRKFIVREKTYCMCSLFGIICKHPHSY